MKLNNLLLITTLTFTSFFCYADQNWDWYKRDHLDEEILCAYALQIYTKPNIEDKYSNPMVELGQEVKKEINSDKLDYYIQRAQHFNNHYSLHFYLGYIKDRAKNSRSFLDRLRQLVDYYLSGQTQAKLLAKANLIKQNEERIICYLANN